MPAFRRSLNPREKKPQRASEFPVDVGREVVATASWTVAVSHASTGRWCRLWLGLWLWLGLLFRFFSGRHLVQVWRGWEVNGRLFLDLVFLGLWAAKLPVARASSAAAS